MALKVTKKYGSQSEFLEALIFTGGNFTEMEKFVGGDAEWNMDHMLVSSNQGQLKVFPEGWVVKDNGSLVVFDHLAFKNQFYIQN